MADQIPVQLNPRLQAHLDERRAANRSAAEDPALDAVANPIRPWVTPTQRRNPPSNARRPESRLRVFGPRGRGMAFGSPAPRRDQVSSRPAFALPYENDESSGMKGITSHSAFERQSRTGERRAEDHIAPLASQEEDVDLDALIAEAMMDVDVPYVDDDVMFFPTLKAPARDRPNVYTTAKSHIDRASPHAKPTAGGIRIDSTPLLARDRSSGPRSLPGKRVRFAPPRFHPAEPEEAVFDIEAIRAAADRIWDARASPGFRNSEDMRQARERSRQIEQQLLGVLSSVPGSERDPEQRGAQLHSRRSIPPKFRARLERELGSHKGGMTQEMADYYANEMTRRDARGIPGVMGEPSLVEEIMRHDAIERLRGRTTPGWRPLKSLGSGGQGGVILWEKVREDGPPIRLATKDMKLDGLFFRDYNNEGHMTRRLNDAGCENVIKVLEWTILENPSKFRIAYEVADYGDLSNLIKWYDRHGLIFPEPFLWHVFHSLANALTYLALGHNTSAERAPEWEEIVHGDLKPANILVCAPTPTPTLTTPTTPSTYISNPIYPTIKMADFGFAYTLPATQPAVRRWKSNWTYGTPGYRAPEIDQHVPGRPRGQTLYTLHGSHSDIWSVARLMFELYTLVWRHYPAEQMPAFVRGDQDAIDAHVYSELLLRLMSRCLAPDGRHRPAAWEVFERTGRECRKAVRVTEREAGRAMREGASHGLWSGKVLMEKSERKMFEDDDAYREAYKDVNLGLLYARKERQEQVQAAAAAARGGGEEVGVGDARQTVEGVAAGEGAGDAGIGTLPKRNTAKKQKQRDPMELQLRAARRRRAMQAAVRGMGLTGRSNDASKNKSSSSSSSTSKSKGKTLSEKEAGVEGESRGKGKAEGDGAGNGEDEVEPMLS